MGFVHSCAFCDVPIHAPIPECTTSGLMGNFLFGSGFRGKIGVLLAFCDKHLAEVSDGFPKVSSCSHKKASELTSEDFDWQACRSSAILKWAYDPHHKAFAVQLASGSYAYFDVEQSTVDSFMRAPSKGRYWTVNIKRVCKGSKPLS